jgi:ribosomal protein S18 acetylase RimI-like enzyme
MRPNHAFHRARRKRRSGERGRSVQETMSDFNITIGSKELLDRVRPLWEELNAFHIEIAKAFSGDLSQRTFDIRKAELTKSAAKMHIQITSNESDIGYCVCTINSNGVGEIDSIYVTKEYRSKGIGRKMVESALLWLDENHVRKKVVVVLEGNTEALAFYKSFGFLPRNVELQHMN